MVKIQQDKNGNGYFYLVKYYNCVCLKNMAKKRTAQLTWLTHVAGSFEHTVVLRAVLSRASTFKPLPKQKIGFSSSTGFLNVRLALGIWLSVTYKHQTHLSKPNVRLASGQTSQPTSLHRHIGHSPRFHALVPRLTRAVRQYFVLFRQFCVVFRPLCVVFR